MAFRNGRTAAFRPVGLSDTVDGTNTFPGAMAILKNLIPLRSTKNVFGPRPGAIQITDFAGFNTPLPPVLLGSIGSRVYGLLPTSRFPGHDEPFCYDMAAGAFVTIAGVTAANTPATQSPTGDWVPPTAAVVGTRIIVTHPGFPGGTGPFFGWFDISNFNDSTHKGTTNGTTTITALSADVLQAGWTVGQIIQSSSGDIPAGTEIVSIASDGLSLVMSAAATGSHTAETLTVTAGTPAAPLWGAGNLNGIPLVAVPNAVIQFNNRAWYAVNFNQAGVVLPGAAWSDAGNPTQATNAGQVITLNNGLPITTFGPLALTSPITGGVTQAFYIIQGSANIVQVTGDPTTQNLAINSLNLNIGTNSPNSLATTPNGLMMAAPDGLRMIDLAGTISSVIGAYGNGVSVPFQNAITPTRIAAAYNMGVYRITVENISGSNTVYNEYWFDLENKITSGPHSFTSALVTPLNYDTVNSFVVVPNGFPAGLWRSDVLATNNSVFTENGVALTFNYTTSLTPTGPDPMKMQNMAEMILMAVLTPGMSTQVSLTDQTGSVLDTVAASGSGSAFSLWGTGVWGQMIWGSASNPLQEGRVSWDQPLVYKQMAITISGTVDPSMALGNIYAAIQDVNYALGTVT